MTVYLIGQFAVETHFTEPNFDKAKPFFSLEAAKQKLKECKLKHPHRFFAIGQFEWFEWSDFA